MIHKVLRVITTLAGLLLTLAGIAVCGVACWIADGEYFHFMDDGFVTHDYAINGHPVSPEAVLLRIGGIGIALLFFAGLTLSCGLAVSSRKTR